MAAANKSKASASGKSNGPDLAITITNDHVAPQVLKANKRMAKIWADHGVDTSKHAIRIDSDELGVSEFNRIPNMQYVHGPLGQGMRKDGFDPDRIQIGWVRKLVSQSKTEKVIKYNQSLCDVTDLYPPMHADKMRYEMFACTHATVTFKLFRTGSTSPMTGNVWSVPESDTDLAQVVNLGHFYHVLDEKVSDDDCRFICDYKNASQNKDAITTEVAHFRPAQRYIRMELLVSQQVKLSSIVAKITASLS